ncbi:Long-chain-fatty-acid--CoA ligase [Desulfamplus magnetovallimortis]|uniref:Long-chain-fatty-acid--CoA ligase n=1 Tax=Desulfamplus magnetovallimortis TaxID=1246637 RepID=A0A1W1HDI4_9BACT|nr:AMP-binding protein [Desulfamplus magnetovallimortis]SLM30438.1 Long-chain-fatty-acid--CoA ligase [Desulfamplus magnetovallimortis]
MENSDKLLEYSIPQLLRLRITYTGDKIALREKDFGIWNNYTWKSYYDHVRKTALGLREIGIFKGENIALISDNIPELLFVAIGAHSIGAVTAGIYQTSMPDEIAGIINSLKISAVFCDNQEQVDKLLDIREDVPGVKKVIFEDPRGMRDYRKDKWFISIEELYQLGDSLHKKEPGLFDTLVDQGSPDDVCHLCLTSGTTGMPKGTMMTHRNYINMGVQITKVDPLNPGDEYVSFLPFAWIGEQMNSFGIAMATGITINFPESVETAMSDLKEIGPHFMFGAPRIYENLRSSIWLKIDQSYWLNKIIYNYFIEVGQEAAQYRMRGETMPPLLRFKAWLGKQMIFRPLVNQMGLLRLRRAYTGGAALGPELFTFYQAIGVNLKQIYGQTEITGIAYMHRDGDVRPDSVGMPLPGTECKISDEGEILSKSLSVSPGYFEQPEKTRELLEGGWLHSGDAGYIDEFGHLVVIDRVSDVMHNHKNEMFSPMFLENKLKFSPYIKEAVIFGDKREFVAALINIDPEVVGKWAEDRGISYTTYMDLAGKKEVAELVMEQVKGVNERVEKEHFRIERFALLYKLLDVDDGELTKTGKIRRKVVMERYKHLYEGLYDLDVESKEVEASFQYQDGQSATVKTTIRFYSSDAKLG